ncbi:hypothetical protein PAESOLCIP111_05251 [Paenibacillus solanacearum]|uniref:Uncharacterized protein n=1 Tax=Paenibacillus solanacearum TaxID=2048548 RepID=A0A916K673_9BACL|nr:hypothetical protein [Paenibacillus solanacearum]CAG7646832.1 hypothetical protein PAESOLCIP111_05251 [Paenibacillus solanacearum]
MIVGIDFGIHQEFIDISEALGERIEQLQTEFLGWLYNKEIDHEYWIYKDGEKWGVNYNGSAFVEWLNNNVSEKLVLLQGGQYISTKTIYF